MPVINLLITLRDSLAEEATIEYTKLLETNPIEDLINQLQAERCEKQMQALKEVLAFCKNKDTIDQASIWESQRNRTIQWCYYFRMPTEFRLQ